MSSLAVRKVSTKDVAFAAKKGDGYIKQEKRQSVDVMTILSLKHPQDVADYAIQLLHKHLNHNHFIKVVDKQFVKPNELNPKADDMEIAYITLERTKNILDDDNPRIETWDETYQVNIRSGKIQRI
jgi:hypothetical protein